MVQSENCRKGEDVGTRGGLGSVVAEMPKYTVSLWEKKTAMKASATVVVAADVRQILHDNNCEVMRAVGSR